MPLPWKSSHDRGLLDCTYLGNSDPVISGGLFSFACHQAGLCLGSVWGEERGARGGRGRARGRATAEHSCHSFLVTSVRFGSGAWQSTSVFKSCNLVLGAGPVQASLVFQMKTVFGLSSAAGSLFMRTKRGRRNHSDIVHCAWVTELGAAYVLQVLGVCVVRYKPVHGTWLPRAARHRRGVLVLHGGQNIWRNPLKQRNKTWLSASVALGLGMTHGGCCRAGFCSESRPCHRGPRAFASCPRVGLPRRVLPAAPRAPSRESGLLSCVPGLPSEPRLEQTL